MTKPPRGETPKLRPYLVFVVFAAVQVAALTASDGSAFAGGARLTISATPPTLDYGGVGVVVTGQLSGKGNAGQKIVLHTKYPPQASFSSGRSVVTNGSGSYRFVFPVHSVLVNTDWYVSGPGGARSPTLDERVGAYIESPLEMTKPVLAHHLIDVAADIDPGDLDSDTFYLEQQVGSSWKKVASGNAGGTNLLQLYYTPAAPGTVALRIWWPGDAQVVATRSKTITVTIKPSTTPPTTTTTTTSTTPAALTVTVTAGEPQTYTFRLSSPTQPKVVSDEPAAAELTVPPGDVAFEVSNPATGIVSHTFEVCTTPLAMPVKTLAGVVALPDSCSGEVTPLLAPGSSATLTVDFTAPGAYEYLSTANNPEGDAFSGMKGVLNVT